MKKIFLILLLTFTNINAQEYKLTDKTIIGVFEVPNKSKAEIFSEITKWISINYNSSKNVIQLTDIQAGNIIIKGNNLVKTKNAFKKLYPNSAPEFNLYELKHLIEINVKDNKYRITYSVIDIVSGVEVNDGFNMDCIKFNGVEQYNLEKYNDKMDRLLRNGLVGKKKRDDFKLESVFYMDEVNNNIVESAKEIMNSIQQALISTSDDGW